MPKPRRKVVAAAEESLSPPAVLPAHHSIMRVVKAEGNNVVRVAGAEGSSALVELPSKFRSVIWLRRGSFVVVDTAALAARENKLAGEIYAVVLTERAWRKMPYWPAEFQTKNDAEEDDDEDEEESNMGKMPPSSDDDDDEDGNNEREARKESTL